MKPAIPQKLYVAAQAVALIVWWGGLTFYAAVVVPVGTEILGSETQGMVTQQVTHWINAACWLTLLLTLPTIIRQKGRVTMAAWATVLVSNVLLQLIHSQLDVLLAADDYSTATFYPTHRWYLLVTTVQWSAGLIMTIALLFSVGTPRHAANAAANTRAGESSLHP